MGKKLNVNITINSIEGLPMGPEAGQVQIRYGTDSRLSTVKSPLRTGLSSDVMETFTFPLAGSALQFDVFHVQGAERPSVASGACVISSTAGYSFDGPVTLLDKCGKCDKPVMNISITVV